MTARSQLTRWAGSACAAVIAVDLVRGWTARLHRRKIFSEAFDEAAVSPSECCPGDGRAA